MVVAVLYNIKNYMVRLFASLMVKILLHSILLSAVKFWCKLKKKIEDRKNTQVDEKFQFHLRKVDSNSTFRLEMCADQKNIGGCLPLITNRETFFILSSKHTISRPKATCDKNGKSFKFSFQNSITFETSLTPLMLNSRKHSLQIHIVVWMQ